MAPTPFDLRRGKMRREPGDQPIVPELEDPREAAQLIFDVTVSTLKSSTDADACTALVAKADQRFEATFDELRKKGARIACKAGCSFCCHLRVTVTPPEAIALFCHLRSQIPAPLAQQIEQRLLANADQIAHMTDEQHLSTNVKCAFLVDGTCSAYRARPLACALHHSLDVAACENLYQNPADFSIGIRRLKVIEQTKGSTHAALSRALEELRLSDEPLELNTAVAAILRDQTLIARWRSGRPLLEPTK
jgi:Fe-S-cluster containining protein